MNDIFYQLQENLKKSIIGQNQLIDGLIIGLLCNGHLLLEGMPGLAKTRAVNALANSLSLKFQRIQFTPDLIPGDITGTEIYSAKANCFEFIKGPIFSEIVLADEINRAPPKVQSALLEAMQEKQVTIGNNTHTLDQIFSVIATQNPIDQGGTYPLPAAQLDRFLMKIQLEFPDDGEELAILKHQQADALSESHQPDAISIIKTDEIFNARNRITKIYIDEMLEKYIVSLVSATRHPRQWDEQLASWIKFGASPRASYALCLCAKAIAFKNGRDFVEPDDIIQNAENVLGHRIVSSFAAKGENVSNQHIVKQLVNLVPIP